MAYKIGIDYDGVIADTNAVKSAWIAENLGMEVPPEKCDRTNCVGLVGEENYEKMGNIVYEKEASLNAPPIDGMKDTIKQLAMDWEIFIVTARKAHRVEWTKLWLESQGIADHFTQIFSSENTSKAEIVNDLSLCALLDDDIRHLGFESQAYKCHFSPSPKLDTFQENDGVVKIPSWPAFQAFLSSIVTD